MGILEYIVSSIRCLQTSKMRTFLTALGIIVGINSVILINIIGSSLGSTVENIFKSLSGGSSAVINTHVDFDKLSFDSVGNIEIDKLKAMNRRFLEPEMLEELEEHFDHKIIRYEKSETGFAGKVFYEGNKNSMVSLTGVSSSVRDADRVEMTKGRFVLDSDVEKKASVAVIPTSAAKEFFGKEDPIGKTISFSDNNGLLHELTVVGVYKPNQQAQFMLDNNESAAYTLYIPYTYQQTENNRLSSTKYLISELGDTSSFSSEVSDCLAHYFEDTDTTLTVQTADESMEQTETIIKIVTAVISAIAAISLIVGGIGVMNIMLVSVNERTMEIGVRKAMGANNSSIRFQFLTESVMISLIGSAIGILSGIVQAKLIALIALKIAEGKAFALSVDLSVPVSAVLYSVLFSFAIGIIFGVYPANKAAKMEVVDALRYE